MTWSGLVSLPPSRDISSLRTIDVYHVNLGREMTPYGIFLTRRTGSINEVVADGSFISVQDAAAVLLIIDMMVLSWNDTLKQR